MHDQKVILNETSSVEGNDLAEKEQWRALQWLGEQTASDPRFARTMVGHAYYLLAGRHPLLPPKNLEDPFYEAKSLAYQAQQHEMDTITTKFVASNYNFKEVIKDWVLSDFYRADGLSKPVSSAEQMAMLQDVGVVRLKLK